ncbi:protease inhibitor [Streptomyces ortus]|uniref:Probable subtilase-type protease inhibitor n=1 Tax=Streptomyces ortus TaxID=2867268 RepID=A0ABT3VHI5_9ACTN|nr:protease inhibitor [Streptomyces ortus]MCX4238110.1 protease inhibitor [Streptomyces ortus]
MPNTARWAATITLTATAVCGPLAGTALATPSPTALYAPSALVFTTGHGEFAAEATPERAVTLNCAPTASGTHPAAVSACAELRAVSGDFDALSTRSDVLCTREYDPVVVTVEGVWQGKRISYERTFANECVKESYGTTVFTY